MGEESSETLVEELKHLLRDVVEPGRSRVGVGMIRVDAGRTRVLCKKLLEKGCHGIPDSLRAAVWLVLLGCYNKLSTSVEEWIHEHRSAEMPAEDTTYDVESDEGMFSFRKQKDSDPILRAAEASDWIRVLRGDLKRTRTDSSLFKGNSRTQSDLELILTYYCVSRGVAYKQGLNELLAPFLALRASTDLFQSFGKLYLSFYSLIRKFLPSIYDDDQFESLQLILRLFQQILQYHDPEICAFLDENHLLPELYAIPWFITLFARNLPLENVFPLWDLYIVHDDPFLHYLMALAIIIYSRNDLFDCDDLFTLPGKVANMQNYLLDSSILFECVGKALEYRSRTPLSFRQELFDISFSGIKNRTKDQQKHIFERTEDCKSLPCMVLSAKEIIGGHQYHEILQDGSISYIVLDCRSLQEFQSGHLSKAIHLDLMALLESPQALDQKFTEMESIKGCHLCFMGNGIDDEENIVSIVQLFLERLFPYVSWCRGGYKECHSYLDETKDIFVDHSKRDCLICSPSPRMKLGPTRDAVKKTFLSGLSTISSMLNDMDDKMKRHVNKKSEDQVKLSAENSHLNIRVGEIVLLKALSRSKKYTIFKTLQLVETDSEKVTVPRILAINNVHIVVIIPAQDFKTTDHCIIEQIFEISNLLRITSKRGKGNSSVSNSSSPSPPKCLTLYWQPSTYPHVSFFMNNAKDCIDLIKSQYALLHPSN